ncbi:Copper/zinc superoxide dismutase 2 isoform 1 [Hibiscus syriacus]|uniref:Copper/zinc superoxide dismutase 2 isoform 1 n=1 Tax=Hibiscus syriacus TaxID=106335 RepID=A0A6A2YM50_HIBSY|nr:zinc finger protein ZAT5-like [Hibiscus syriacus]KAE8680420.1 Copper/zinc superoxide dismutase 2 isoform 1 [Hibiscus syriacus]
MQSQEGFLGFNDSQTLIMKGKRTKRQRPASLFGVMVTSSSSSGGGGVAEEYNSISSPTTTSGDRIYESTEEEEEMANCLILLAQSDGPRRNVEFYVYQCKTCNRSFPSFQALGGHMASHKKPKSAIEHKKPLVLAVDDAVMAERLSNKKGNKIHECSICGSEFTSGQALGGHMRWHRAAATAAGTDQPGMNADQISINTASKSNKPLLDLNLPAPEDDLRDSQFQAIVFSTPALVDCHY